MEEGTIVKWNADRGFGFIQASVSKRNIFVHFRAIKNRKPEAIREGDAIEFTLASDKEGRLRATDARIIDPPGTECTSPVRFGDIRVDEAA